MRRTHAIPCGNGEALIEPPFDEWEGLVRRTAAAAAVWDVEVGGMPLSALRSDARADALRLAGETCRRLGIAFEVRDSSAPIVMTGHQPELFHPGVWSKHFAIQKFADQHEATPLDLVVDSDRCGRVSLRVPCVRERVRRHDVVLADGGDACYGCVPAPSPEAIERFANEALACAKTLPGDGPYERVQRFVGCLNDAVPRSRTIAEAVVVARRSYETPAVSRYGEVFVTDQAAASSFLRFAAHLVRDAQRFTTVFNDEVRAYRARRRVRSAAHPFPELSVAGGIAEVPLWVLVGGVRRRVAFEQATGSIHVEDHGVIEAGVDDVSVVRALEASGLRILPRAVALTMFERLCVADLFVHGVGGSRYEFITDRVIERWLGVAAPPYAVVSLTMRLPVGSASAIDERIAELRRTLHVAKHNPDKLLDMALADPGERARADAYVQEKRDLIARASEPGADKRAVGQAIRAVNARLEAAIRPFVAAVEEKIQRLECERGAHEALSDRECSFPLFDPLDVMDAVG
ncbi:hypothetical protein MX659_04970 [Coriobacteriia bacterium Es71-Z0120]|uniref:hypothetical protein n=1 Tax=Parvivirga hydrogeniphila TaxID=2939460 RepID=UPI002260F7F5|nr:hypothetical protein [Parvivirga hydrogeniphila]MCL4078944.1 hypothetical protein [Parvivirga hydrogeniphila]